jgi:hypothetical protein
MTGHEETRGLGGILRKVRPLTVESIRFSCFYSFNERQRDLSYSAHREAQKR